jgi:ELWxxDGT repeat protein
MKNTICHRVLRKLYCVTFAIACMAAPIGALGQTPYLVKDINPGPGGTLFSFLSGVFTLGGTIVGVGDTAYFQTCDPTHGNSLWKTDGTEKGTKFVADDGPDVCDDLDDLNPYLDNNKPWSAVNNTLIFRQGTQLWRTDGTSVGTFPVYTSPNAFAPLQVGNVGDVLYFADLGPPCRLLKTDGTAVGTTVVAANRCAYSGVDFNGTLIFESDFNIWRSDGTSAGTVPVFVASFNDNIDLRVRLVLDGVLYFRVFQSSQGSYALWRTDGTNGGTGLVKAVGAGSIEDMVHIGSTLYFRSSNQFSNQLWRSDGTPAGTVPLNVPAGTEFAYDLVASGSDLLFSAFSPSDGVNLWRTTGAIGATPTLVTGLPSRNSPIGGFEFTPVGNRVYFTNADDAGEVELWKVEGAAATLVADILPGPAGSDPKGLTAVNDALYFWASDGSHGGELWAVKEAPAKSKCASKKMTALGKNVFAAAKCYAKAVSKGVAVDAACLAKADGKLGTAVAKAEASADCTTTGDTAALASAAGAFVDTAVTTITGGAAGPNKCDSKKITAAGKEAFKKAKCYAKAASSGKVLDLTCLSKEGTKLVAAFIKAELGGGCSAVGDAGALESQVTAFVADTVEPLAP